MNMNGITHLIKRNDTGGTVTSDKKITTLKDAAQYLQHMIEFGEAELADEKVREKYEVRIRAKLETGKALSAKELQYLRKNNPALYAQAIRVEAKRKSVEARLKNAGSKQEVEEIQFVALSTISDKDPAQRYMMAAVKETVREFKQTQEYRRLPERGERDKKNRANDWGYCAEEVELDKEEDKITISYEFSQESYQIAYADKYSDVVTSFSGSS